ncbi:MAG: hypothetical protein WCT07_03600 [Candidatus Paceibacterota bacterium]|jgi:hypothetical protein
MGDVIYLSSRHGTWDEVYSAVDANGVTLQVFRHSTTNNITIAIVNAEGEAIEAPLSLHDFVDMAKAIFKK